MSLERIIVFLLAENCLLREALVRVLRKKDDLVVAGAIPFSPSALKKISAANPDVALFDSASVALTGPCLVSRMRQAGEKPKAVMVGIRLGLSNKEIGNRLNLSEQTVKNHMHLIPRKLGAKGRFGVLERCHSTEFGTGSREPSCLNGTNKAINSGDMKIGRQRSMISPAWH